MPAQRRLVRLWRRARRSPTLWLLAFCLMFAGVIAGAVYSSRDPVALSQSFTLSRDGGLAASGAGGVGAGASVKLKPDDPVRRFSESRIGHVLFTRVGSDDCRRSLFDNPTGAQAEAGSVFCGQDQTPDSEPTSPDRLNSLKRSFQR